MTTQVVNYLHSLSTETNVVGDPVKDNLNVIEEEDADEYFSNDEQQYNDNPINSVSKFEEKVNIRNITDDDIPQEWRINMYQFFQNGKPRTLESDVRFKILNNFFYADTKEAVTHMTTPVMQKSIKSYQSKTKDKVNKFLTMFSLKSYNITERAVLLELFVKMLIDLPRVKLENFQNCKEKCDYLYSFFNQNTLKYFDVINTLKSTSTREIMHIKCILYDLHFNQQQKFIELISHLKGYNFLIALRHTYMSCSYIVAQTFNSGISLEKLKFNTNLKQFILLKQHLNKQHQQYNNVKPELQHDNDIEKSMTSLLHHLRNNSANYNQNRSNNKRTLDNATNGNDTKKIKYQK